MGLGIDISSTGGGSGAGIRKVADEAARLALSPVNGDYVTQLDDGTLWYYNGATWELRGNTDPVLEVLGTDSINLTKVEASAPYDDDTPDHLTKLQADVVLSPEPAAAGHVLVLLTVKTGADKGLHAEVPEQDVRDLFSGVSPVDYDPLTGVFSMAAADNSTDGYMPATLVVDLETVIQGLADHLADTVDAHEATAIGLDGVSTINATVDNVADGMTELANRIDGNTQAISDHIAETIGAHEASAISYDNTSSGLVAGDVQAALDEVDQKVDDHIADTSAAHAASAIDFTPAAGLTATDVQAALAQVGGFVVQATEQEDSGSIIFSAARRQLVPVRGDTTEWTITADLTNLQDGDEVLFVGQSDTFPAILGTNFVTNGPAILGENDTITTVKLGSVLIETARSS